MPLLDNKIPVHWLRGGPVTDDEEFVSIKEGHPVVFMPVVFEALLIDSHLRVMTGLRTVRDKSCIYKILNPSIDRRYARVLRHENVVGTQPPERSSASF